MELRGRKVEDKGSSAATPKSGILPCKHGKHRKSIAGGRLLSSLKELAVSSWKVCLRGWEVGKRGAYVSSAARIGMGRMERGGQAER